MRADDAFWAARRVMAFTDDLIRAIVKTGQFSDPAAEQHLGRRADQAPRQDRPRLSDRHQPDRRSGARRRGHADVRQRRVAARLRGRAASRTRPRGTRSTTPPARPRRSARRASRDAAHAGAGGSARRRRARSSESTCTPPAPSSRRGRSRSRPTSAACASGLEARRPRADARADGADRVTRGAA